MTLHVEFNKLNQLKDQIKSCVHRTNDCVKQTSENKIVQTELGLVSETDKVFKLIGPALVKIDVKEARQNVENRIKYLSEEKSRYEKKLKELGEQQNAQVEKVEKLKQAEQKKAQGGAASGKK